MYGSVVLTLEASGAATNHLGGFSMSRYRCPASTLALSAVLFAGSGGAQADIVTLDFADGGLAAPPTFAIPYSEDGFNFTTINQPFPNTADEDHFDILNSIPGGGLGPDGEREAIIHTGNDGDEVIVDFDGAPFKLVSLEIEEIVNPSSGHWEIVGSNGAQLTFTSAGTVFFDQSWIGLQSIMLRSTSVPDDNDFSGFMTFDNIVLDTAPTTVPLPAPAVLLVGGLGLVASLRRRRAAQ